MTATLLQLRTDARSRIDEVTARFWTDSELNTWINEGCRDIARRAEVLEDRVDITVTAGVQEYSAPTDTVRIYRIEWIPTGTSQKWTLEYRDWHSLDNVWGIFQSTSQGYPIYYSMWGFVPNLKIDVFPIPSQAGVLHTFYYRLPVSLTTDGQTAELPEGWQDLVAVYCTFTALMKDGDRRWQDIKQDYEGRLSDLIDLTRRHTDQTGGGIQFGMSRQPGWLFSSDGF